jgi:hypothetical protein
VPESADAEAATFSVGTIRATFSALYVVTPAHVSGAASTEETPSGTGTTYRPLATAYSANAPSME